MNEQQYRAMTDWVRQTPRRQKVVTAICRTLPYTLFVLYAAESLRLIYFLVRTSFTGSLHISFTGLLALLPYTFWIVPAAGLILVSLIRKKWNLPRPSELFDFTPLLRHETGCSCPSRHTASSFLIASALLWMSLFALCPPLLSVLGIICAVCTALSRILAGVHFPRDVLAGAAFGVGFSLLCYIPYFFLLLQYAL